MKNIFCLIGLVLFVQTNLFSQFNCGLNKKLAQLYAEDPQLEKDHEALFRNNAHTTQEKTIIFTIPIVFHILHYDGAENIADAQIYDAMDILNQDYRLLNSDTSQVIPEFKNLYADAGIEFKLATIDPYGNCTNGIEHIYSHETFQGDDYSKLHQWYRSQYLNVWIVDKMENGVAGYSYYPTAVDGSGFWRDGVIILHDYVGSIGTGSPNNSRALTHEIGHYLGLSHPWGSTNDPGVACGNDYIEDTPITKGSNLVCNTALSQCVTGVIENVQNYMDYSYCSHMFTIDQVSAMRNILQGISANRDHLISDTNHIITGINVINPPICKPIAYFKGVKRMVCVGQSIQFFDQSYNAQVTNRLWDFADGTANSTTSSNPTVTFNTPGYKSISLIVSNNSGADTILAYNYIYVAPEYGENIGPIAFDMEDLFLTSQFIIENPELNHGNFEIESDFGKNQSNCFKLDSYKNVSSATTYSDNYFYYNRLAGTKDAIITPSMDLRTTTSIDVSFDFAYATNAENEADITEVLNVYVSRNCGETWTLKKSLSGVDLLTAGNFGYSEFNPTSNNFWRTENFSYTSSSLDDKTRFKFEFVASDFSNNFFLDNIQISGLLGFDDSHFLTSVEIYPNPIKESENLLMTLSTFNEPAQVQLTDAFGNEIKHFLIEKSAQEKVINLNEGNKLSSGCYFVNIESGQTKLCKKVIVIQ
jgi:PKD repeat protein